ncbi:MAG: tRNA (N6-isopentenyl adenosine(37)-C2)-methylthiotransferase MiaB [Deltaproteobacteria bacterium]|nr:tRNA (N6-isopentenyl adenosine(37)-C2)-methylthiotransferase MiaB [Deltaproteobacteria bacterium]
MRKRAHINTMGCQMNVQDSGRMRDLLASMGYEPEENPHKADLVLVNTCMIREKAEEKAFSFLGRMAKIKRRRPHLLVCVAGCVSQAHGKAILKRAPYVDVVLGTGAVTRLPKLVEQRIATGLPALDTEMDQPGFGPLPGPRTGPTAFVTIMTGCDNFCSYCVVPHVRGREKSRPPDDVLAEVRVLAAQGVSEVTLLGQNVNSYGKKEGLCTFPELLEKVHAVDGIRRIRFVTSHPKDLSPELINAFSGLDKLCGHIHLPIQSGSDRILAAMNRKYTADAYMDKLSALRAARAGMAVTTDFIVGFPGETERDFEKTMDLVCSARFDGLFAFKYSDRPHAPASRLDDKVPEKEKARRLAAILDAANAIIQEKNQALAGSVLTVLVEGASKQAGNQATGRTSGNRVVNFEVPKGMENQLKAGAYVDVAIEKGHAHSLWGRVLPSGGGKKPWEMCHAA